MKSFILTFALVGMMVASCLANDQIQPITKGVSRAYISDQWSYTHIITAPNSNSEGSWGILIWDGKVLGYQARVNDYYATPWGDMYWHGQTIRRLSGPHFFLPYEKEGRASGRQLFPEDASEKLEPVPVTTVIEGKGPVRRVVRALLDLLPF